jgi:hypothetical protein
MPSMMKKAYYIISPEIVEHKKKHITTLSVVIRDPGLGQAQKAYLLYKPNTIAFVLVI